MKFHYKWAKLPNNKVLINKINKTSSILYKKLAKYDINKNIEISDYNKRYFGSMIMNKYSIIHNLQKYSYLLLYSLPHDIPLNKIVFMDYGGGHGMLALLAKAAGIGTVIHNDIYEISCKDARLIGNDIDLAADYYIPGNIDDVIHFRNNNNIDIHVIANYDVIEHIYDIEDFLNKLPLLSNTFQRVFLASAANELNPIIKNKLRKQHIYFENNDREYKFGRKPTDETRALIKVRKEIISEINSDLNIKDIEQLAKLTRGLLVNDIKQAVTNFVNNGDLPIKPLHPTNTCDPYTGNWFEHLMDPFQLRNILIKNGYVSTVIPGYYGKSGNIIYNIIKTFLNIIISINKMIGLRISPFYAIWGLKKYN
jgi:2-polyprenyl-3-methyl-5-hydroxy-6-metoxy-1,4-benzoquinol methylase